MKIVSIKLQKIMTGAELDRFTVQFSVQFEDEVGEVGTYFSDVTVGVPYDGHLTHEELLAKALYKLHSFFRAAGAITRDQVAELFGNGIDHRIY